MFFVYILKSDKDNNLYVGVTNDLKRRLQEHNKGQVKSTKYRRPLKCVYHEAYKTKREAMKQEWILKHTPGGGKLKKKLASMGL